jgi:hypothetical protein
MPYSDMQLKGATQGTMIVVLQPGKKIYLPFSAAISFSITK